MRIAEDLRRQLDSDLFYRDGGDRGGDRGDRLGHVFVKNNYVVSI